MSPIPSDVIIENLNGHDFVIPGDLVNVSHEGRGVYKLKISGQDRGKIYYFLLMNENRKVFFRQLYAEEKDCSGMYYITNFEVTESGMGVILRKSLI